MLNHKNGGKSYFIIRWQKVLDNKFYIKKSKSLKKK